MDAKHAVRERMWDLLEREGAARFPGARGRIPNFRGAEQAAGQLAELREWQAAGVSQFVAAHVAPYKKVRAVEIVDEIPKAPSGKILRRVLVERERAAAIAS